LLLRSPGLCYSVHLLWLDRSPGLLPAAVEAFDGTC
jgi:hypothetical protein